MAIFLLSSTGFFFFWSGDYVSIISFSSFRWFRLFRLFHFGGFVSLFRVSCRLLPVSLHFISARVNFKFDSLHHICVFMSNLHLMCFNICIYATDLYLKALTEKYGDKNCVDFMQIRQFIEHIHMFIYTCQACAQCFFVCVFCLYMML